MKAGKWIVGAAGVVLICVVGSTQHVPGAPAQAQPVDCQAQVVATDGTPPPGVPRLDPQALCDAADQAVKTAECMGDQPDADRVNARELCLEIQRRGCGNDGRDCGRIPADQTYFTRH